MAYINWHPLTLIAVFLSLLLCGCDTSPASRENSAQSIAASAYMSEHNISSLPFTIRAYERVEAPAKEMVRIYIEGDGLAWIDRGTPSLDPTPTQPVALSLAAIDSSDNVVYLARPCQYFRVQNTACNEAYWTSARFSPIVIESMSHAIDDIKARYNFRKIELVGYSGGAAIALLVAAERQDVISIRTVAGAVDMDAFEQMHQVSISKPSLNPASFAVELAGIPQLHFIGADDDVVPLSVYQKYVEHFPDKHCLAAEIIPRVSHETGWEQEWPDLLSQQPRCDL